MFKYLTHFALVCTLIPYTLIASQDKLTQMTTAILNTQKELKKVNDQKEAAESSINELSQQILHNAEALEHNEHIIKQSDKDIDMLNLLEQQEAQLAHSTQSQLNMLLTLDYSDIDRTHHVWLKNINQQIHEHYLRHHDKVIMTHKEKATSLADRQKSMDVFFDLSQRKESLKHLIDQKKNLQNDLDQRIKDKNKQLKRLQANKHQLELLIKQDKIQTSTLQGLNKKRYPIPVKGHIEHHYGDTILFSDQQHDGVTFSCEPQPVKAIAKGIVAYADYLEGYGHLVIIDHGHHDLSLYGQNLSLKVHKGDHINANQTIATSSDHAYFAIRKNKKPVSPTPYLIT